MRKNYNRRIANPAQRGEKFLIIGNFKNNEETNYVLIDPNGVSNSFCSNVYIDDVSLTEIPVSVNEPSQDMENFMIYPNPFSDQITFDLSAKGQFELRLYNLVSTQVYIQSFNGRLELDGAFLQSGIYIYEITTENGFIKRGKVVKY